MLLNIIKKYIVYIAFFVIFASIISVPTFLVPIFGLGISICLTAGISVPVLIILHALDNFVDLLDKKSNLT
jgi:hypothetical protein